MMNTSVAYIDLIDGSLHCYQAMRNHQTDMRAPDGKRNLDAKSSNMIAVLIAFGSFCLDHVIGSDVDY